VTLLLDTHVFWWAIKDPSQLSKRAMAALEDEENELVLSVASWWELVTKRGRGGIDFPASSSFLPEAARRIGITRVLPIEPAHVLALDDLPKVHGDPFDRIIIAQAKTDRMTLVSGDTLFKRYKVPLLW